MILGKTFKLLTAYTGCVIYQTGQTQIIMTGINSNNFLEYNKTSLENYIIKRDQNKYNYCINSGARERKFLIQYFIENNILDWFVTDIDNTFDYFDGCFKKDKIINIIEVKFRDCFSYQYPTDYIFQKKYNDLFYIKKFNGGGKNIKIHYILIFKDYIYRSYELSNIELEFNVPIKISDHPGSSKKKEAINGELDIKLAKTGKIKFK